MASAPTPYRLLGPNSDFKRLSLDARVIYLRRELIPHAAALAVKIAARERSVSRGDSAAGEGNRAGGFRLTLDDSPELFVRLARRGGLMRLLVSDVFVGIDPRPLRELAVAVEARRRGIPLAEPMGALVRWVFPGLYRGAFITRALRGMTLWEFVKTDDDPDVRGHVIETARRAIDTMHQHGLVHADLNLGNLFVTPEGESFSVIILDLDKARLLRRPVPDALRRGALARLIRSIRKLDPAGRYFDARARSRLGLT